VAYWELLDLTDRLGEETIREIFDDDRDGTPDQGPIERLQKDSDSKVDSYLRPIYDLALIKANPPNEVRRLSLDIACVLAKMRWPSFVRGIDADVLLKMAEKDLEKLRRSETRLDTMTSPDPPANVGGFVGSGDADYPDDIPPMMFNTGGGGGLGDF
jgi:hypothetical protein